MTPHGPDAGVFEKGTLEDLKPVKFDAGLAFMFETFHMLDVCEDRYSDGIQEEYANCWMGMKRFFEPGDIHAGPKKA